MIVHKILVACCLEKGELSEVVLPVQGKPEGVVLCGQGNFFSRCNQHGSEKMHLSTRSAHDGSLLFTALPLCCAKLANLQEGADYLDGKLLM